MTLKQTLKIIGCLGMPVILKVNHNEKWFDFEFKSITDLKDYVENDNYYENKNVIICQIWRNKFEILISL